MNDGDQINCPWCGNVAITDLWEVTKNEEGEVEADCDHCGRTFLLDTLINVMTTAKRGHGTIISWEMHRVLENIPGLLWQWGVFIVFGTEWKPYIQYKS